MGADSMIRSRDPTTRTAHRKGAKDLNPTTKNHTATTESNDDYTPPTHARTPTSAATPNHHIIKAER